MVDFEVKHQVVGTNHVFYVPKEIGAARGAGLTVTDRDEIRGIGLFEIAMATARRHGKVPQSARWHLDPAYTRSRLLAAS